MPSQKLTALSLAATLAVMLPLLMVVDSRYVKAEDFESMKTAFVEFTIDSYEEKIDEIEDHINIISSKEPDERTSRELSRLHTLTNRRDKYLRKVERLSDR